MQIGQKPTIVKLSGSLSIERASTLKDELSAALALSDTLVLDVASVEDFGLSCLQVLYSASASAKSAGKRLHFVGSLPSSAAGRLAACGFLKGSAERPRDLETALVGF
jgi:anti-anti-sigma regulatory factor